METIQVTIQEPCIEQSRKVMIKDHNGKAYWIKLEILVVHVITQTNRVSMK